MGLVQITPKYDLFLLLLVITFDRFVKKSPMSEIGHWWASSQGRLVGEIQCESA